MIFFRHIELNFELINHIFRQSELDFALTGFGFRHEEEIDCAVKRQLKLVLQPQQQVMVVAGSSRQMCPDGTFQTAVIV